MRPSLAQLASNAAGSSEAHARADRAIQDRALPTPEDRAIFQQQLRRVLKDCGRHHRTPAETLAIVRRWTSDYLGISA